MSIHRRFITQFLLQLFFYFIFISSILLTFTVFFGYHLSKAEIEGNVGKADELFLEDQIQLNNGHVTIQSELKELVKKQSGWLLIFDNKGQLIKHLYSPKELEMNFSALIDHKEDYDRYYSWQLYNDSEQPLIVMFGQRNEAEKLIDEIASHMNWTTDELQLPRDLQHEVMSVDGSVFLSTLDGTVLNTFNNEQRLSIKELYQLGNNNSFLTKSISNQESNKTLIVSVPNPIKEDVEATTFIYHLKYPLIALLIALLLTFIISGFLYSRKFASPVTTVIQWIENLGNKQYTSPTNIRHQQKLYNKSGVIKHKYRLYKEVMETLSAVTIQLEENEKMRKKQAKTREDWISGLSHDLKTPLSSIVGYTKMLNSDQYQWSLDEKKHFIDTIDEKSHYMMELIEDLTLTYRLQNNSLPIIEESIELNETIRRTIIQTMNMQDEYAYTFDLQSETKQLIISLDPKWFQRILDNLIMNAVKYNPKGTTITITTQTLEERLVIITIEDNGIGMDDETLDNLFDRYYRGTNTTDSSTGTGLGMAITKQLVKLHGGSIKVHSDVGMGTKVRIILPIN
ncbi:sensor histidine kinase [Cytobacillus kochii]